MIPKRLYTTWIGCPGVDIYTDAHRALFAKCYASWRRLMPDYALTIITRENVFDAGWDPLVAEWYERGLAIVNWAEPAWLRKFGGIYLDMDVEAVQRFDTLREAQCFVGRESDGFVNTSIHGAVAGHSFAATLMDLSKEADVGNQNEGGPRLYTKLLKQWGWDGTDRTQTIRGITVHKSDVLYPYLWTERFTPDCVMPDTMAIHHWASTWQPKAELVDA